MKTALFLLISALILVKIVKLQILLSKKQNKWLGLIIPLIFFLFSVLRVLGYSTYSTTISTSVTETSVGEMINRETIEESTDNLSNGEMLDVIPIFIATNILTFVFLMLYFTVRKKQKENLELQKMNIQDLG